MKYWFTIHGSLPEDVSRTLWDKIAPYNANLTVLWDKTYIYGDTEPEVVYKILVEAVGTGYRVERG